MKKGLLDQGDHRGFSSGSFVPREEGVDSQVQRKQQRLRRTREGQDAVALAVWPSDEYLDEIEGLCTNVDR